MVVNIQAEKEMYRQISEERTGKRERTEYTDKKEQTELHTTVRMISTARFSVHILLLHHYKKRFSSSFRFRQFSQWTIEIRNMSKR